MNTEERLKNLENRVAELESLTMCMRPIGPNKEHEERMAENRAEIAGRLMGAVLDAIVPPVDRSQVTLTDGEPVKLGYDKLKRNGQQEDYMVLSAEERAKGFVRPVRRKYVHNKCGGVTTMSLPIAETYARDPKFYNGTFCCHCCSHFPLEEFKWDGTDEVVGS